jgi:glycosyltransferase involved in cell wall biosynthesis
MQETMTPAWPNRLLARLARFGVDLRPHLRRARDVFLVPLQRPLVAEIDTARAAIVADLDTARAAIVADLDTARAVIVDLKQQFDHAAARIGQLEQQRACDWLDVEGLLLALMRPSPRPLEVGPLVSVVMATRDRAHVVSEAIRSVMAQSYRNWELIIIDDGSVDSTPDLVATFNDDPRVNYERRNAQGAGAARNAGLARARGELVAYLDDDNLWYPGFLSTMVTAFLDEPTLQSAYAVLVRDPQAVSGPRLLMRPFDRERLVMENFIDLNVFVHRRSLYEQLGGFDETLPRLIDWDLILRYTERQEAKAIATPGAQYRYNVQPRISTSHPLGYAKYCVTQRWSQPAALPRPLRVLYALYHYPQASETYIEAEIGYMRRLGIEVEVWSEAYVATPYASVVPVHVGSLEDAIDGARPDLLHTHWLNSALNYEPVAARRNIPMTARAHGFDTTPDSIKALLDRTTVQRLFLYEHQRAALSVHDPRLTVIRNGFDTTMFAPTRTKERKLVVRTAAALASKDLGFFLELAKRLPDYRFVLAVIACNHRETYVDELLQMRHRLASPAEIRVNLAHAESEALIARAGIYLHTVLPPGEADATPIGQPVSIAEAMATGCYVLVRDQPPLVDYVGEAGAPYRDLDTAAGLIAATGGWDEAEWRLAAHRGVNRAWSRHAGDFAFRPIYDAWVEILGDRLKADRLEVDPSSDVVSNALVRAGSRPVRQK